MFDGTVQVYCVPVGTISIGLTVISLLGAIVNAVPVQIVCVLAAMTGVGFEITTTLFVAEQPFAVMV